MTAAEKPKRLAVVGAGPAGLAFATTAAQRGHHVTLFEADNQIGGQFNIAKQIPGKEEFHETLRYFKRLLIIHNIQQRLGQRVEAQDLTEFDEVILATGIIPRYLDLPGSDMPHVLSYAQVCATNFRLVNAWPLLALAALVLIPPNTSANTVSPPA